MQEVSAETAARLSTAFGHHQRGDHRRAEALYRELLASRVDNFDATHLLGVALTQRGAFDEGIAYIRRAIAIDGTQINARLSLVRALLQTRAAEMALAASDDLANMQPRNPEVWLLRGNAHQQLGAHQQAIDSYRGALAADPRLTPALNNLGHSLRMLRRADEALVTFQQALQLQPGYAMALNNQGLAFLDLQRPGDAVRSFDAALAAQPHIAEVLSNRGSALFALKAYREAADCFARLVRLAPHFDAALGSLLYARRNYCDWSEDGVLVAGVIAAVERGEFACLPLAFLSMADSLTAQLSCARTFSQRRFPTPAERATPRARQPSKRVRVAYLSGDFGEHAVSYLLSGVIERHDRSRFDTVAVAWGRRHVGPARARLEASFDSFMDVSDASDADVAARLRDLEIDIAVDLSGHTGGQRTDIFTHRAAPIQVNYLGFPATMGTEDIDYILADEFLIPPEHQIHYREHIAYLPECFQANDGGIAIDSEMRSRTEFGLPESGLVFCSFHGSYKLNPRMFDVWARLIRGVPDSVLWLLGGCPLVEENLRREAAVRGLSPERLIFAPQLPYRQHLARLQWADLCLDTLPFNGGATTSDALRAGVPVVTCAGQSFAARMSGSLLHTLGVHELVAGSLSEYEQIAMRLARDRFRLASVRSELLHRRSTSPLFDTARFCRHLEAAYSAMVERHARGLPPATFKTPALPAN
jgi:protein O-GlcNAc transferase